MLFHLPLLALAVLLSVMGVHACTSEEDQSPGLDLAAAQDDAVEPVEPSQEPILEELPDAPFNPAWIGAACQQDGECAFEGGFCLQAAEGFPGGHCTKRCTGACPQKKGDVYSASMCAPDPRGGTAGLCVARCALHLLPGGCREGYACSSSVRLEGSGERLACLPAQDTPEPTACTNALDAVGAIYRRPGLHDATTVLGGARETCRIPTPLLLSSPVRHVDFRESGHRMAEDLLLSCDMARAVQVLAGILEEMDVVEVEHVGTYNCRGVAGTTRLSAHASGRALDITAFERSLGTPVSVLSHWKGRDGGKQRFLRELVKRIRASGVFRVVLTPDSNAAHRDHLHLEIP